MVKRYPLIRVTLVTSNRYTISIISDHKTAMSIYPVINRHALLI